METGARAIPRAHDLGRIVGEVRCPTGVKGAPTGGGEVLRRGQRAATSMAFDPATLRRCKSQGLEKQRNHEKKKKTRKHEETFQVGEVPLCFVCGFRLAFV